MTRDVLSRKNSLLLVIDVQQKFRPAIFEFDRVVSNVVKLVRSFDLLEIPIIVTEHYPKGLGETVKEVKGVLKDYESIEKVSFDCFNDKSFNELMEKKAVKNLIICGIEAHVCVFQTALSALAKGYEVYLVADAISSRKRLDWKITNKRLEKEGAKLASAEMIIFQMIKDSKDKKFKDISKIVK